MKLKFIVLPICVLALASCVTRYEDVKKEHVFEAPSLINMSRYKIKNRILSAAKSLKWDCVKEGTDVLRCTYSARQLNTTIRIFYGDQLLKDRTHINIQHVSSSGMNGEDGKIHIKYGKWVRNLQHHIIAELRK